MTKTLSLDAFKALGNNQDFKSKITGRVDSVDFDNGTAIIYAEHINKYLEKYSCKDVTDLEDTLWFNYGVFVKVID
jgi:hypothetical protein